MAEFVPVGFWLVVHSPLPTSDRETRTGIRRQHRRRTPPDEWPSRTLLLLFSSSLLPNSSLASFLVVPYSPLISDTILIHFCKGQLGPSTLPELSSLFSIFCFIRSLRHSFARILVDLFDARLQLEPLMHRRLRGSFDIGRLVLSVRLPPLGPISRATFVDAR